ncbi:hypothetical protein DdX_18895 [Ditylenchus destructor]|uniref:Uncharacterized protein n=1 Tax=Ditylenchus destructor TaxID=166010 RepID=A0AAD4MLF9_9BILA|nr:hypothetical protein DdX_18895 [Ditylenchus destructor]
MMTLGFIVIISLTLTEIFAGPVKVYFLTRDCDARDGKAVNIDGSKPVTIGSLLQDAGLGHCKPPYGDLSATLVSRSNKTQEQFHGFNTRIDHYVIERDVDEISLHAS